MEKSQLKKILKDLKDIVRQAGKEIMWHYDKELCVIDKDDNSPVTIADVSSENIILNNLAKYKFAFLSEETKDTNRERIMAPWVWIIDPLDGTKDFLDKTDEFSVMVGLVHKRQVVLGAVYVPAKDEMYWAMKDRGAFMEKGGETRKIKVSKTKKLDEAKIIVSRHHLSDSVKKISKKLAVGEFVQCGSAGYKNCLVARGEGDITFNTSCHTLEWDICASDIIVREAGGQITDMRNKRFKYNKRDPRNYDGYLVTNFKFHYDVIDAYEEISAEK